MQAVPEALSSGQLLAPPSLLALGLVLLTAASFVLLRPRRKGTVPGPSWVPPVIGETAELVYRGPAAFFLDRYHRYGGIYVTNILGLRNVYCILEPSAARAMLRGEGTAFCVPFKSVGKLIGDYGHMVDGPTHTYFRKVFSTATSLAAIERILPRIVDVVDRQLQALEAAGRRPIYDVGCDVAVELAMDVVMQLPLLHTNREWFKRKLITYVAGMFTLLPFNIPGLPYHAAYKAKQELLVALTNECQESAQAVLAEDPDSGTQADMGTKVGASFEHALAQAKGAAAEAPDVAPQRAARDRAALNAKVAESMRRLSQKGNSDGSRGSGGKQGSSEGGIDAVVTKAEDQAAAHNSGKLPQDAGALERGPAERAVVATQVEANLEVLRTQRMVSAETVAGRTLSTFLAAVDTTRNSVLVVMGLLAELPEEADKLKAEQDKLMLEHGEAITPAVLAASSYLDAFCREAMRLLPPARVGLRMALRDLQYGGHTIPKDATLLYTIDFLHAVDPVLWDGKYSSGLPQHMDFQHDLRRAFQPERWLSDATRPKHHFTFSTGAHLCLGMQLVYTELKVLTALMVRRGYRVATDKPCLIQNVTLFPNMRPPRNNRHVRIWRPAAHQ